MFLIAETIGRFAVSIPLAIAITMVSFAAFSEVDPMPGVSPADGDRIRPALRSDDPGPGAAVDPANRHLARAAAALAPSGRGASRSRGAGI